MRKLILGCILTLVVNTTCAQTIAEKKAGLGYSGSDLSDEMQQFLTQVNKELEAGQNELKGLCKQVMELHKNNAPTSSYKELLERTNAIKTNMRSLEERWREMAMHSQLEGYALWHQPATTLEQLVIDYGSQDYVYLISPQIAEIALSINSNLPIPRASWDEMLEIILTQNGVGIKQLNPFLRELYLIKEDRSGLKLITNNRNDIEVLPCNDRIAFLLTPEPSDVRRVWSFLEKFTNHNSTVLQILGRDILIIATVSEIKELLKLYDFALANRGDKEYKVLPLNRIDPEEMAKVLEALFGYIVEEPTMVETAKGTSLVSPSGDNGENGLKIIALGQIARAVFLVGTREEIRKAENLIHEVEAQVGEAREKVIYWYNTKNSDAEELAQVLEKIYGLMVSTNTGVDDQNQQNGENAPTMPTPPFPALDIPPPPPPLPAAYPYDDSYFLPADYVVNKMPPQKSPTVNQNRSNFLVDPKTGSIVMVVEADILPKMKDLIKRLDVPKKMVQIEVLLFEKRIRQQNQFGLNLLRVGDQACDINNIGGSFNNVTKNHPNRAGVFEFLLSQAKHGSTPAFDVIYKFLLNQEDIQINANPSVLAVNQTAATIEIAEEISVNTGIYQIETNGGTTLKDSFARAQYGIKIGITPTIHISEEPDFQCEDDCPNSVTLETDITFQTFSPSNKDRPDVVTRHIVNEVRIPDGQTVILGGLRRKNSSDRIEKIPFLGEIPGLGKLFSSTEMRDDGTEMFIFLTPKIIFNPCDELEKIKLQKMSLRPGDLPEFLCALDEAWENERASTLQGSMRLLFGRTAERCIDSSLQKEYDGR
jgi:general secretion pathway protein D